MADAFWESCLGRCVCVCVLCAVCVKIYAPMWLNDIARRCACFAKYARTNVLCSRQCFRLTRVTLIIDRASRASAQRRERARVSRRAQRQTICRSSSSSRATSSQLLHNFGDRQITDIMSAGLRPSERTSASGGHSTAGHRRQCCCCARCCGTLERQARFSVASQLFKHTHTAARDACACRIAPVRSSQLCDSSTNIYIFYVR